MAKASTAKASTAASRALSTAGQDNCVKQIIIKSGCAKTSPHVQGGVVVEFVNEDAEMRIVSALGSLSEKKFLILNKKGQEGASDWIRIKNNVSNGNHKYQIWRIANSGNISEGCGGGAGDEPKMIVP